MDRTAMLATVVILSIILGARGQTMSVPCTTSMMNSFTPCVNFITGSTANGGSPTAECCSAFRDMMGDGVDCACLIITGSVPVSLPFNRTLALTLPRACKSNLPLQCKGSGVPLPAPGPVLFAPPSQAPVSASPFSPRASKASAVSPPSIEITPPPSPATAFAPIAHPSSRPAVVPSASNRLFSSFPPLLLICLSILVC